MSETTDLLKDVEHGGCSAKLPAGKLKEIVSRIPVLESENLMVGSNTSDDAMVMKMNSDTAIIQTTDFFPPVCSDPYDFGQVAAANALSDIYAMGGTPISALNLVMFPSAKYSEEVLLQILKGGAEKVIEAGAVLGGGHTIDDPQIKYGLAVTGTAHPDSIVTNTNAEHGDVLILTKGLGTAVIVAGRKIDMASDKVYNEALASMKQLNSGACEIMKKYNVKAATDITGFSLCGHACELAEGSGVRLSINLLHLPMFDGVYDLINSGCIPTATFRNLKFMEEKIEFPEHMDYNLKMLAFDAQTSGGLLMSVKQDQAENILSELIDCGYEKSTIIGEVTARKDRESPLKLI